MIDTVQRKGSQFRDQGGVHTRGSESAKSKSEEEWIRIAKRGVVSLGGENQLRGLGGSSLGLPLGKEGRRFCTKPRCVEKGARPTEGVGCHRRQALGMAGGLPFLI